MLTFIATVIIKMMSDKLQPTKYSVNYAYKLLSHLQAILLAIAPKGVDPVLSGGRIRHFHKKLDKGLVQGL